jgi:hypothetical protein
MATFSVFILLEVSAVLNSWSLLAPGNTFFSISFQATTPLTFPLPQLATPTWSFSCFLFCLHGISMWLPNRYYKFNVFRSKALSHTVLFSTFSLTQLIKDNYSLAQTRNLKPSLTSPFFSYSIFYSSADPFGMASNFLISYHLTDTILVQVAIISCPSYYSSFLSGPSFLPFLLMC